jgi:hypothetical protein
MGVVNRARKIFVSFLNNHLNHFIHFQLPNNALICLQVPSKSKLTLGKITPEIPIFTMQNSSGGTPHGSVPQ